MPILYTYTLGLTYSRLPLIYHFNLQEDYAASGIQALKEDFLDRKVKINCEYKVGTLDYVTVFNDSNDDLGKSLVQDGLMMVDKVRDCRLAKVVNSYVEAKESAKKNYFHMVEIQG